MAMAALVANPGSASRKYAIYAGEEVLVHLHFEYEDGKVVCTIKSKGQTKKVDTELRDITESAGHIVDFLKKHEVLPEIAINRIGLRVVAPTGLFLRDHIFDEKMVNELENARHRAPLHIDATLEELHTLRAHFKDAIIVGISDSAFHASKPDKAWNYGLPLSYADRFDIKRFGYHGLSCASVVRSLKETDKLPPKVVVCHLGSGASVTAIKNGKSIDTTMGYSPLEGLVMATRAGSVDATAVKVLKDSLGLEDSGVEKMLHSESGLLGLSGSSSDIRELLKKEEQGDHRAELALQTYVYSVQKAIGQMTAALGGADMLVFTGTVGERSAPIRGRVMNAFDYLDFILEEKENNDCINPATPTCISQLARSKPVFVVPSDEAGEIARQAQG